MVKETEPERSRQQAGNFFRGPIGSQARQKGVWTVEGDEEVWTGQRGVCD